jgi:hypothetical protein
MAKISHDLVVATREIPGVSSLARIIGRNFLVFKPANGRIAGAPKLLLRVGLDALCFFPGFREDDNQSFSMVNPKTRFDFQTPAIVNRAGVVH